MYLKRLLTFIKEDPMTFVMGMSIITLAVMGTSVRHVSSSMFGLLFLLSFSVLLSWPKIFVSLSIVEKLFVVSFVLYTSSGLVAYINVDDVSDYVKLFERYFRFLMAVPIFLLIIKNNKSLLNYLYIGAALSGPFVFFVALNHYYSNPDVPAKGYYHHIIFGQLAMLNIGILLGYLITNKLNRIAQILIVISILLGLSAAILSQARGVWLAFPFYILIAVIYLLKSGRFRIKAALFFIVSVVFLVIFTPASDLIKQRAESASNEISAFYEDGNYISSVGTRLAMWEISYNVWKQHPILGTGPGDFDDEVIALQDSGEYVGMDVHDSVHNIYIQALVTSGVVGFFALVFLFGISLVLLLKKGGYEDSARFTGVIVIVSFVVFGVSESWTLRLSIVSVFLVYLVTIVGHLGVTLNRNKDLVNGENRVGNS